MPVPPANPAREIINRRVVPYTREQIIRAWTDAELLANWWGPKGFRNTFHVFEPKPGGQWRFIMHGPDGRDYPNDSTFLEITPERIVLDHISGPPFRLVVTFTPKDKGTEIEWRMIFENAEIRDKINTFAAEANEQNFDRLEAVLAQSI